MSLRSKLLGTLAAAAAIVASIPVTAGPAAAATPCRAIELPSSAGPSETLLLSGAYTAAGATDVQLACGAVRNGVTIALARDELTGPVAVVNDTAEVGAGSVTSCYVLRVVYLDRPSTNSDTCP